MSIIMFYFIEFTNFIKKMIDIRLSAIFIIYIILYTIPIQSIVLIYN